MRQSTVVILLKGKMILIADDKPTYEELKVQNRELKKQK
jgi:hypothetical protein